MFDERHKNVPHERLPIPSGQPSKDSSLSQDPGALPEDERLTTARRDQDELLRRTSTEHSTPALQNTIQSPGVGLSSIDLGGLQRFRTQFLREKPE